MASEDASTSIALASEARKGQPKQRPRPFHPTTKDEGGTAEGAHRDVWLAHFIFACRMAWDTRMLLIIKRGGTI